MMKLQEAHVLFAEVVEKMQVPVSPGGVSTAQRLLDGLAALKFAAIAQESADLAAKTEVPDNVPEAVPAVEEAAPKTPREISQYGRRKKS